MSTATDYLIVAILIVLVAALAAVILGLTHLIGPKRHGPVKESIYESGVDPVHDARKRFNVRFYLVAVLFLVFDVEIIFLYPWAILNRPIRDAAAGADSAAGWATDLAAAGYGPGFLAAVVGVFFVLLTVGFIYEWRKGIFRWD